MKISAKVTGVAEAIAQAKRQIDRGSIAGLKRGEAGLRAEMQQLTGALVHPRLAKTWRGRVYPNPESANGPASLVYTRAPEIISFWTENRVYRPRNSRFFAIPTAETPRGSGGARLSPREAADRFGGLTFRPATDGKRLGGRQGALIVGYLTAKGVVRDRNQRLRPITDGQRRRGKKTPTEEIMFVLVTQTKGVKLIDLDAIAARWSSQTAEFIRQEIEKDL